jgi:DnaJ family protein A protein 2
MFFGGGGGGGFPFGDFEEMGGGGFPGGRRGPPREVDNTRYYEMMGVPKTATKDEIKKAFRKKAIKEHPDKGGDEKKFQELTVAYEVLMDEDKRKMYDRVGEEGMKEGGGGGHHGGMEDLLGGLFGGGMGGRGGPQRGPKKGKSVMNPVKCTLEDIYKGKVTKMAINRERICTACEGLGGKQGAVQSCSGCNGRGMKTTMTMVGPGMYSQRTGPCEDCGGQGEQIDEKNRCKECVGKKT